MLVIPHILDHKKFIWNFFKVIIVIKICYSFNTQKKLPSNFYQLYIFVSYHTIKSSSFNKKKIHLWNFYGKLKYCTYLKNFQHESYMELKYFARNILKKQRKESQNCTMNWSLNGESMTVQKNKIFWRKFKLLKSFRMIFTKVFFFSYEKNTWNKDKESMTI